MNRKVVDSSGFLFAVNILPQVIVNFTCQLDRAKGCPDIMSNRILGVPEGVSG